jgi:hypothetical protein
VPTINNICLPTDALPPCVSWAVLRVSPQSLRIQAEFHAGRIRPDTSGREKGLLVFKAGCAQWRTTAGESDAVSPFCDGGISLLGCDALSRSPFLFSAARSGASAPLSETSPAGRGGEEATHPTGKSHTMPQIIPFRPLFPETFKPFRIPLLPRANASAKTLRSTTSH